MNRKATLTALALALCSLTGTASANDGLPTRAVNALGAAVAAQGNAALVQIRRELKESALEAMKPFLPDADKAPEQQPQPASTPTAQR
jgi:hypothetical protein